MFWKKKIQKSNDTNIALDNSIIHIEALGINPRKQFNFPETFWSDNACGYRSNILLFSFDCNLTSLLPSQND